MASDSGSSFIGVTHFPFKNNLFEFKTCVNNNMQSVCVVRRCVKRCGRGGVQGVVPGYSPRGFWEESLEREDLGLLVNNQDLLVGFPALRLLREFGQLPKKSSELPVWEVVGIKPLYG